MMRPAEARSEVRQPPSPLYRDPIYDGAADPTVVWNHTEGAWWIVYTQRRANIDSPGVAYGHGTDIGIASSTDGGRSWLYRGTLQGLEFERGRNSFWAPEVIRHEDIYHMYVSYVRGVPSVWSGTRHIVHMTSENLWDWRFQSLLPLSSDSVIDACVHRLPSGTWRLWYKDEIHGSFTYAADSDDLHSWRVVGAVITDCPHEGPNVFFWRGSYWMVTDAWKGLAVYRSRDCADWVRHADILCSPGRRPDDGWLGHHADVLVQGDRAYIFYFVHPERDESFCETTTGVEPYATRRTSLQVAELELDGERLVCDRDRPFDFALEPEG
jgi:hypothetical protein